MVQHTLHKKAKVKQSQCRPYAVPCSSRRLRLTYF